MLKYTAKDLEDAWNISGVQLENGEISAVDSGDLNLLNNRLSRARKHGTLNVSKFQPLSSRQIRLILLNNDLLQSVENEIENLSEPQKTIAKISWEYSTEFEREHPFINLISDILELSESFVDSLWINGIHL